MYRVATDVGGTFTDIVYYHQKKDGSVALGAKKTDSTPPNFEQGVLRAIDKANIPPTEFEYFAHGTTVVINALLSKSGAKVGLLTTQGFRDVLEIARGNRPDLFNFCFRKSTPFVERYLRLEIDERTNYNGAVENIPDLSELKNKLDFFRENDVEAIAICFLHSYINPENERIVAEAVRSMWPEVSVVPSHVVSREWREYERTNSAVLSAYVHPVAERYLDDLKGGLSSRGFQDEPFIMQSNGGVATVRSTVENPITIVESGPASGMLGAMAMGGVVNEPNMIALDIGGTTAKCSLIQNGVAKITTDYKIEWSRTQCGYPIKTPVIEIVEIGNGGGSIAWLDEGKKLHVGPQSAGSTPGPVGYGRGGTQPTTTDAHILTQRIGADYFVAGEVEPDMAAVTKSFEDLAQNLAITKKEAALGVIRIANANMTNALKLISVNKGYDPRDFSLLAFGGGGAMHAVSLAAEIGVTKVIIPANAGVFSAWGMLMTDLRRDVLQTHIFELAENNMSIMAETIATLCGHLHDEFSKDALDTAALRYEAYLDMRYDGQEHTVKVKLPFEQVETLAVELIKSQFHEAHEREYTYQLDHAVEVVNIHMVGFIAVERPTLPILDSIGADASSAIRTYRQVMFDDGFWYDTPVYRRSDLLAEMVFAGPAVIEAEDTTALIQPGWETRVDCYGNLFVINDKADV